jgi:pimeloyl-ACP methyl ester carboxylesterase
MYLIMILLMVSSACFASEEITPYKFTDQEVSEGLKLDFEIPQSSRFALQRLDESNSEIIYYVSKPQAVNYPIAICCGGSSTRNELYSIIHFHRYFLQEFLDLDVAVLTVEQRGIDGNQIDEEVFWRYYTRSARLRDHQAVIENLKLNPPVGWNGKIILLGVSEGGPLVTSLTQKYCDIIIATINWSGAGDLSWREQLWLFIEDLRKNEDCIPYLPANRFDYNACMDEALANPTPDKDFLGMTYLYHADALQYPQPDYEKIQTPFLVVAGVQDSIIDSSDVFVQKAKAAGANITYLRIEDMDHYIRKRPEIIELSFQWLSSLFYKDQPISKVAIAA